MSNPTIREQTYSYFLAEAQDLLHSMEQDLLSLREERSPAKVHSLMRAAHTLKGAAASVGFNSIKTIAHSLEDVFKTLYKPEVEIDAELETLLFEGYECLRLPLMIAISAGHAPEGTAAETGHDEECLARSTAVFEQLKTKLGKHFDPGAAIPTSAELGFDITRSLFETGVQERLAQLELALAQGTPQQIEETLQTQAEVFVGLAESLNLPGFGAIAQTALKALKVNPDDCSAIAQAALTDFRQGQSAVLAGDRSRGGDVSEALKQLSQRKKLQNTPQQLGPTNQGSRSVTTPNPTETIDSGTTDKIRRSWIRLMQFLRRPLWSTSHSVLPRSSNTQHSSQTPISAEKSAEKVAAPTEVELQDDFDVDSIQSALEQLGESLDAHPLVLSSSDESTNQGLESEGFELWDEPLEASQPEENKPLKEVASVQPSISSPPPAQSLVQPSISPPPPPPISHSIQKSTPQAVQNNAAQHFEASTIDTAPQSEHPSSQLTTVRVHLEHLESLHHNTSELLIHQNRQVLQDEHVQLVIGELVEGLRRHQQTMMDLREWADQLLTAPETLIKGYGQSSLRTVEDGLKIKFDALELDRHHEVHELLQSALEELVPLEMEAEALNTLVREGSLARSKQGRLLNYLRDDLMLARMMPIGAVLNRLPRIVQQLTERYGKQVELRLSGTQVLVDKAVAEKLFDPLLHLIRNAFDHGIEPVEIRCERGKSEVGCIDIRAYQQGNRTLIDVRDDGRGLDLSRICQRGFELQRLPSDQVDQFSQAELFNLLFESGFSTVDQVSELSGRGVGLDVVRSHLQSIRGNITLTSELHQGTTFSLQLPLTLMSARLLICQVGQAVYGLLSDEVERVLAPEADQLELVGNTRVFHWRQGEEDCPVPVHSISQLMHYTTLIPFAESTRRGLKEIGTLSAPLLLVRRQGEWVGLEVDRIIGEQELVIRPLGTILTPPSYIYGCSVLGDGRLILVVDGVALVQRDLQARDEARKEHAEVMLSQTADQGAVRRGADVSPTSVLPTHGSPTHGSSVNGSSTNGSPKLEPAIVPPTPQPALSLQTPRCALVIDDSITVRQALTLTLQEAGYDVVQAQDGLDAILQLQQHPDIQVITCDVEMPRLNGFEFLMRYRQETGLKQVPVIMLTSRSNEKHQQLAMQLGASAYMTKPFSEEKLLSLIDRMISGKEGAS
jgi:chemotaxis family two-component system sensor histidine kinase/response regulator PixL